MFFRRKKVLKGKIFGCHFNRAEKSKIAAQSRRDKEAVEMAKLIELLPFEQSSVHKLDKNALLELILNYLQMKRYLEKGKYITSANRTDIYSADHQHKLWLGLFQPLCTGTLRLYE
jgi:hypothetical protein